MTLYTIKDVESGRAYVIMNFTGTWPLWSSVGGPHRGHEDLRDQLHSGDVVTVLEGCQVCMLDDDVMMESHYITVLAPSGVTGVLVYNRVLPNATPFVKMFLPCPGPSDAEERA